MKYGFFEFLPPPPYLFQLGIEFYDNIVIIYLHHYFVSLAVGSP